MKILERRIYRGPNLYAHFPVIRLRVDLEALEDWPTAKLPGFVDRLLATLPSLETHTCSYGTHGGFIRRMREAEGTWLGHVLEHVAIEIQVLTGAKVSFGKTRSAEAKGQYHVVYEFEEERVGEAAGALALRLVHSLLPPELAPEPDHDLEFQRELDELIEFAQRRQFGPSTASLIRAAEERDIPWIRLNDHSLVQLGHGRFQKRIQATVTSETRHISVEVASDKEITNRILADLGLPVPRQYVVRTAERAAEMADRLGYPVVVKPLDANHGRGVSIDLGDGDAVRAAFAKAAEHARWVIVETFIRGFDHRMLVVAGELIAVAKRVPGHVLGDGVHTIEELVDIVNQDPRRGIGHEKVLTRIELDYQARRLLEQAGIGPATILPEGQTFYLRSTGNLSTGGTAIDLTDVVHPDNREVAVRAARAIGLDVAGIDFISPDISQSHGVVGGAICEVNAAPGFRMHVAPTEGTPRDVAGPVIEMLFPQGTPSRIPIAAVTGTNGKTTVARMLAHIQKMSGFTVGLCSTDGVYIDGERTVVGDMTGPMAAQMVLRDPRVDFAVLETARGGLLRAGMGYRSCNVGCVLNVTGDHLGVGGIDSLDQLAEVKRIVVEVARDVAVLNADDERCLLMGGHTEAKRIAYVTMNPRHDLVRQHIRAGGSAAVLEEGMNGHMIALYDRGAHIPLLWAHLVPATLEAKAMFNVQNAMFAALMAYVMGQKVDNIRQGLRTFDTTYFQAPGRLNVFDKLPFKVILDYGHNPAATRAMTDLVARLEVAGERVCVLSAPGDRRDEDIVAIATVAAPAFDRFVLRTDDDARGRPRADIARLLAGGLREGGVRDNCITVIEDETQAIDAALASCQQGDLLVIFGDKISRCWKQITKFKAEGRPPGATVALEIVRSSQAAHANELLEPAPVLPRKLDWGGTLVEDERGVRVVRESVED